MELTNQDYNGADFGIVPEDWEFVQLNDCLDLLTDYEANGSFESIANNVNIYDTENFAWFVRATDLENRTKGKDIKYVDKETYQFLRKTKLFGDEVLITKRGEIGKVYYFKMRTEFATLAPNLYLLKLNKRVLPFYLYCFFISPIGVRLLVEKNASSTLGALYKDDIKSISFPLPTKSEQTAIATALSDTDALIENLEKLIAKKRNIKQGVMQELLKPRNGWGIKKLGDFIRLQTGFPFSSEYFSDNPKGQRLIKNRDLRSDDSIVYYSGDYAKEFIVQNDDLLIGMDGDFEPVLWKKGNALLNQRVGRVLKIKEISIPFLSFTLLKELKEIEVRTSSTTVKHLSHFDINKIEMPLPNFEKQNHIATILTDMDADIYALEKKLNKIKQIKQGMMQTLLTGKIRLV
jgi:type I restriction enzyme S subunit